MFSLESSCIYTSLPNACIVACPTDWLIHFSYLFSDLRFSNMLVRNDFYFHWSEADIIFLSRLIKLMACMLIEYLFSRVVVFIFITSEISFFLHETMFQWFPYAWPPVWFVHHSPVLNLSLSSMVIRIYLISILKVLRH